MAQRKISSTTVEGRRIRVWRSPCRGCRPPGILIASKSGKSLKIHTDPPWENPVHEAITERLKRSGARWNKETKVWTMGVSALLLELDLLADQRDVVFTEGALKMIRQFQRRQQLSDAHTATGKKIRQKISTALPPGKQLYPFQSAAVEFMVRAKGRVLVTDEMGLGKSVETLGFMALKSGLRPAVLAVPAIVTGNWMNELATWLPKEKAQWLQTKNTELDQEADVWVVSFNLLKTHLDRIVEQKPKLVVVDEVHLIKNSKAARTQAAIKLANQPFVKSVIGLSGTPITSRPLEFFTFLNLLCPEEFGNWFRYTQKYCDGHYKEIFVKGGGGKKKKVWVTGGASNTEELNQRLKGLMIRRRKEDVLTELPLKTYQSIPVSIKPAERKLYNKAVRAAKSDGPLAQVTAARQAVGAIKTRAALEWIQHYYEMGAPLLVFCHHKAVLDTLQESIKAVKIRYGRIDGTVTAARRTKLVKKFQDGQLDCMLLSTKAAGIGITLTRAADVLVVERQWTPADEEQAIDRTHRLGQKCPVTARFLVLTGTIDDDMAELLQAKRAVLEAVLDGKALEGDTNLDIRDELVHRLKTKPSGVKHH